ncbi:hypothetical protein D187_009600 [Cystobacter fuscus DSM 2262]|uniref:Uncharacterized protein n=1 Tax=Cystobacter fuscus (strain ATCC 25194 / DSM 2262 / NBRC 100088 / M29) TaxID=1242864 RepID=S9Q1F1_CYSF2|nr:hypothetical protein D187_009600 [Cystobacter fuscus DSM 2262]
MGAASPSRVLFQHRLKFRVGRDQSELRTGAASSSRTMCPAC